MLAKQYRLRRRKDFARLHKRGQIAHSSSFSIKYAPNQLDNSRAAVVISTKIDKRAVIRNRTRRRFYAALQDMWPQIKPGHDLVILTRHPSINLKGDKLKTELQSTLNRAGLIEDSS